MDAMRTDPIELFKNLPDNVLEWVDHYKHNFLQSAACWMAGCTTPIEQIMGLHLRNAYYANIQDLSFKGIEIEIFPQSKVKLFSRTYIADFRIVATKSYTETYAFIIECDGHEFHEKTKQQVRRDRERERDFLESGYTVIRFSGSEIVGKNVGGDVMKIIMNRVCPEEN